MAHADFPIYIAHDGLYPFPRLPQADHRRGRTPLPGRAVLLPRRDPGAGGRNQSRCLHRRRAAGSPRLLRGSSRGPRELPQSAGKGMPGVKPYPPGSLRRRSFGMNAKFSDCRQGCSHNKALDIIAAQQFKTAPQCHFTSHPPSAGRGFERHKSTKSAIVAVPTHITVSAPPQ